METLKAIFWGPDPKVQMQKCNSLMNSNIRSLNRDLTRHKQVENDIRALIIRTSKRAEKNPSQAKQIMAKEIRPLARQLLQTRKQTARLTTGKAQLESVKMQANEAFSVRRIEGSLKTSTSIMKNVNSLVKIPELSSTMRDLSQELMKAGVIEEMVGDMVPGEEEVDGLADEETENEIDNVLGEVLKTTVALPDAQLPDIPGPVIAQPHSEEQEATLEQMRGRLEALRN